MMPKRLGRCGFTLLELVVVMAILAALMAVGTYGYRLAARMGKVSAAEAEIGTLRLALDEYRVEFGRYPESLADAEVFLSNAVEGVVWTDPWGGAYRYESRRPRACRVWSEGPDALDAADDVEPMKAGW